MKNYLGVSRIQTFNIFGKMTFLRHWLTHKKTSGKEQIFIDLFGTLKKKVMNNLMNAILMNTLFLHVFLRYQVNFVC